MKSIFIFSAVIVLSIRLQAQLSDFAHTDFRKADSIAAIHAGHSLKDLKSLAINLTAPLQTDEEKFRSIYKWICENIENDYDFFVLNKSKREKLSSEEKRKAWNEKFRTQVLEKLFAEKKTVCTGYAYLVMKLSGYAGLECVIVDGYGRTVQANIGGTGIPNHSWNAIRLHDKWYLCDATWSSGAIDTEMRGFIKGYDDVYFLPEPSLFVRNHYPLDTTRMLLNDKPSLETFLGRPLVYKSFYRYKLDGLFPHTFDVSAIKGEPVSFHFRKGGAMPIEKVELQINRSRETQQPYENSNNEYRIDHVFKSKGRHVVHLILDSNYVVTYNVKVQ